MLLALCVVTARVASISAAATPLQSAADVCDRSQRYASDQRTAQEPTAAKLAIVTNMTKYVRGQPMSGRPRRAGTCARASVRLCACECIRA